MNRRKLNQADKLLRLAHLREELATRAVSAARGVVAQRIEEHQDSIRLADELSREQAERRDSLRNPMIGSAQLRGALEAVLNTFQGDRQREADAQAAIEAAAQRVTEAEAQLDEARKALARAGRLCEKRRRMREPLAEALAYAIDRRDELEAEERRSLVLFGGRG